MTLLTYFEREGDKEFKNLLGKLVSSEVVDEERLESQICDRIKLESSSRGWKRPSGIKTAPMKLLLNY